MIRTLMTGLAAAMFLVGCTTTDDITGERSPYRTGTGAIVGAIAGAAAGTLAGGDDRRNALIGAGIGALAGGAIGHYMDANERNLRQRLAGTGVGVTRVSQSQILLNFPADLTFDFNQDSVKGQFVPTLSNVASLLGEYPQTTVDVYGHADSVGSDAYNQDLSERMDDGMFLTLLLLIFGDDGSMQVINAGHHPALLVRRGEVMTTKSHGAALGMLPDVPYEVSETVALESGDLLLAFTDGLVEAHDPADKGRLFGEERVRELLIEHAAHGTSAAEIARSLAEAAQIGRAHV